MDSNLPPSSLYFKCSSSDGVLLFVYAKDTSHEEESAWDLVYSAPYFEIRYGPAAYQIEIGKTQPTERPIASRTYPSEHWYTIEDAGSGDYVLLRHIVDFQYTLIALIGMEENVFHYESRDVPWPSSNIPDAADITQVSSVSCVGQHQHQRKAERDQNRTRGDIRSLVFDIEETFQDNLAHINNTIANVLFVAPSVLFHLCEVDNVVLFSFARNVNCDPGAWVNLYPNTTISMRYDERNKQRASGRCIPSGKMMVTRGKKEGDEVTIFGTWDVENWFDAVSADMESGNEKDLVYFRALDIELIEQLALLNDPLIENLHLYRPYPFTQTANMRDKISREIYMDT